MQQVVSAAQVFFSQPPWGEYVPAALHSNTPVFLFLFYFIFLYQIRFWWSGKGTPCHSAGLILLKWLSSSSLQPCHSTLRTADLILPLLLSLSLSGFSFISAHLTQSADTFGFPCCESQVFPSVEARLAAPSASEHFFFIAMDQMLWLKKIPSFDIFFFFILQERNKMKRDSWARLQTWLDRLRRDNLLNEGACFTGVVSLPAQISNQLEKSDCVQLKGCLSSLPLFLFFPCSPKCWQQSFPCTRSTSRLLGNTASCGDLWARLLLGATEPTRGAKTNAMSSLFKKNHQGTRWVQKADWTESGWFGVLGSNLMLLWDDEISASMCDNNILFIVFSLCGWNRDLRRDR